MVHVYLPWKPEKTTGVFMGYKNFKLTIRKLEWRQLNWNLELKTETPKLVIDIFKIEVFLKKIINIYKKTTVGVFFSNFDSYTGFLLYMLRNF